MTPRLCLVLAVARNGVIGRGGGLPWRMPSDLRHFRALTLGKPIIMGRKTFQSIGRPLGQRDNIVVTRDLAFAAAGVTVVASLDAAIAVARRLAKLSNASEIMVIGGAEVYAQALPLATRIYMNRILADVAGDATFAPLDPAQWRESSRTPLPQSEKDDFAAEAVVFDRIA